PAPGGDGEEEQAPLHASGDDQPVFDELPEGRRDHHAALVVDGVLVFTERHLPPNLPATSGVGRHRGGGCPRSRTCSATGDHITIHHVFPQFPTVPPVGGNGRRAAPPAPHPGPRGLR